MNRRNFIKILAGLPLIGSLPAFSRPVKESDGSIRFDGIDSILRAENDPTCGGFTLGSPNDSVNLDDYQVVTRVFDGLESRYVDHSEFIGQHNAVTPKDFPNLTMWQGLETDEHGVTRYIDKLTGEDLSDNIKWLNESSE